MTTNGRASLEGALLAPDGLDHVQAVAAWMQSHPNDRDTRRAVEDPAEHGRQRPEPARLGMDEPCRRCRHSGP